MRPSLQMLALVATSAVIAGCAMPPPAGSGSSQAGGNPQAPRPQQRCDTNGAQWAVGKTNTEHNVNEARKRAGAYMVRVLRPGQVTTRDFNAERLNLEVDATGRIIAARCG